MNCGRDRAREFPVGRAFPAGSEMGRGDVQRGFAAQDQHARRIGDELKPISFKRKCRLPMVLMLP